MSPSDVREPCLWVELLCNWRDKDFPCWDPGTLYRAFVLPVHQIEYIPLLLGGKKLVVLAVGYSKSSLLATISSYLTILVGKKKSWHLLLEFQFQVLCGPPESWQGCSGMCGRWHATVWFFCSLIIDKSCLHIFIQSLTGEVGGFHRPGEKQSLVTQHTLKWSEVHEWLSETLSILAPGEVVTWICIWLGH